ncbi:MAG: tetratricopeptide repeat protein [Candidatus Aegiribacteria sp.]|nr:tetratricopeptide repeat protein [Candidatus Aegiribacteria sp.]
MIDIEQRRKAQELIQKGKYESAEKVLNHIMNQNPEEPSIQNTLGDVLMKLDQQDKALELFCKAGELYCINGLYSAALSVARKALRIDENFSKAHYLKAINLDKQNKSDEAEKEFILYLKSKPTIKDPAVMCSCAAMTRLQPDDDKWVIRLAKIAASLEDLENLEISVKLARDRNIKRLNQLELKLEQLKKKLGITDSLIPPEEIELEEIKLEESTPSSSLEEIEFEEAPLSSSPEEAEYEEAGFFEQTQEDEGDLLSQRKRIGEYFIAEGLLEANDVLHALDIQKESEDDRKLGDILVSLNLVSKRQLQEALSLQVDDMRDNLDRSRGDGLGFVELGNLLLEVGDFYGSIDAYLRACTIYRANEREYMVFELLEGVLDICPESLSAAKEVVRIRESMNVEGQARAFYRLAVAYLLNDSPHEALAALEESVAVDSNFEMARTLMDGIRPGLVDSENYADIAMILADIDRRFDRSTATALAGIIREFQDGIDSAVSKDDYSTHYDLGIAYMEMGLYREAHSEFEQVLISPDYRMKAREMLGRCCLLLERYDEAEDNFRKGLTTTAGNMKAAVGFHLAIADVYEATGRNSQAERELKIASKLDSNLVKMRHTLD